MYDITAAVHQNSGCGLAEFSGARCLRSLTQGTTVSPLLSSRSASKLLTVLLAVQFLESSWNEASVPG